MISRFFISRPIFAAVVAIIIIIAGLVTLGVLPIAQYPQISPPTVKVSAVYPGASAKVLLETVASPIEQQVNGVEGMLYMSSTCANDGTYNLTVTFNVGMDMDMATVLVQNRVTTALPTLPEEVKNIGVTTRKQSTNIVLMISLTSPDGQYDDLYLSNYASLRIKDELARIEGVGDVFTFGVGDYSMRIWLDPEKIKARSLTTNDVVNAIREQNVQVAAGQIGQPPVPRGQNFQYVINTMGRLEDVEQFENIIIKTGQGGRITRVKDVASVELGSKTYNVIGLFDEKPTALLAVFQLPGANAIELSKKIQARMKELKGSFPQGLDYQIPFDTTLYVQASIDEVVETLLIAIILVFFTIFVFLQDWRATLIPAATIPVSLIGAFITMGMMGFSLNMVTLFGIVLSIGIVVDDAIVVVENTARNIDEFNMERKEATIKAMGEVSGPIVATTLVLMAVFIPTAFLGGVTGQIYRQFALTISAATFFSSINALTLSPALCAILLRPKPQRQNFFFRAFNWTFNKTRSIYERTVGKAIRLTAITMVLFLGLSGAAFFGFLSLPKGFFPVEDQGYVMVSAQLPDAASLERTTEVADMINKGIRSIKGIKHVIAVPGYSLLDGTVSSNAAAFWVMFEDFDKRTTPALKQKTLVARIRQAISVIQEANVIVFVPPAIPGLGVSGGFQMELQDRGNVGLSALEQMAQELALAANGQTGLSNVYTMFRANVPQLFAEIDRNKAKTLDIPMSNIFNTLQTYLGSTYVNDFNKFGRTYQVNVQADSVFRVQKEDIRRLEVRNNNGQMVPLSTLVSVEETLGPQIITRYNMYPAASINGEAAPGFSSGQALNLMEQMAKTSLPPTMGFEWAGMSFQEKAAGNPMIIFALAIIIVYLVLCAQYESWSISFCILLSVPPALLGTIIAVAIRAMDINIYTQIGIILLIALSSKNAILIVEFAKDMRESGKGIIEAATEAARLRFRPILMTSFAFILGTFPLVVAQGAGAGSRQALGTAVFGGMIAATFLTIVFVPVYYVVIQRFSEWLGRGKPEVHSKDSGG